MVRKESQSRNPGRGRTEAGSAIVEFALSLSILAMMLFGIMEGALALYAYNFISEASREATRYAIVRGSACTTFSDCGTSTNAQITSYVDSLAYPGLDPGALSATISFPQTPGSTITSGPGFGSTCAASPCNNPGNPIQVTVTYQFPLTVPFLPSRTISMTSTSLMVIQQ